MNLGKGLFNMAHKQATRVEDSATNIKAIPQDSAVRCAIRETAETAVAAFPRDRAPDREQLEQAAERVLGELTLSREYLGFAMVAVDNAFWRDAFAGVPSHRRLLLLPTCLRNQTACQGGHESALFTCGACGGCVIRNMQQKAESLGYEVIVSEGTTAAVDRVMEGGRDAILGIACLDSLEKSFHRVMDLGIAHQSFPLLRDGCRDTEAEVDLVMEALTASAPPAAEGPRSYLPLLREARVLFEPATLDNMLMECLCRPLPVPGAAAPMTATDRIARQWLLDGGKRLRPFVTLAAYVVGRHGLEALKPSTAVGPLIPDSIRRIALAIEALHKASLVHDDIEDGDTLRYGRPTVHSQHGTAVAINVGDYLVGLGYRLIGAEAADLGSDSVADILRILAEAHLNLCCGQGTELLWHRENHDGLRPIHALQIGALKTAPAFFAALYAGLRASKRPFNVPLLRSFCTYVGEGFQVQNDLEDWDEDSSTSSESFGDVLAARPTILRAFALEAGANGELQSLTERLRFTADGDAAVRSGVVEEIRELYERVGAFAKARLLVEKLRSRALQAAAGLEDTDLEELCRFLVRNILHSAPPGSESR